MNAKIYCIVVSYNGARWIRDCLGSLQRSREPVVPLVIDNQSTDQTVSIIKKEFPGITLIENSHNMGFGRANNIGIRLALQQGAEHVLLLNQDARITPDTVAMLARLQGRYPQYGVLSPAHWNGTGSHLDYGFCCYVRSVYGNQLVDAIGAGAQGLDPVYPLPFVNAAAWLLSSQCLEQVGLFHPVFSHYGEDNHFCHRLLYHGWKIGIAPYARIFHDRNDRKEASLKSLAQDIRVVPLNEILDIREPSLAAGYRKAFGKLAAISIKSLKQGSLGLSLAAVRRFFRLLLQIRKMRRIRKETMHSGQIASQP